jgi:hypothetical protein
MNVHQMPVAEFMRTYAPVGCDTWPELAECFAACPCCTWTVERLRDVIRSGNKLVPVTVDAGSLQNGQHRVLALSLEGAAFIEFSDFPVEDEHGKEWWTCEFTLADGPDRDDETALEQLDCWFRSMPLGPDDWEDGYPHCDFVTGTHRLHVSVCTPPEFARRLEPVVRERIALAGYTLLSIRAYRDRSYDD